MLDVVLCGMRLQFFPDREAGLREFHRVLVRGDRLAASHGVIELCRGSRRAHVFGHKR
jgi:ubiquinone/menaquinone biosynthesis C-methylase UbiE